MTKDALELTYEEWKNGKSTNSDLVAQMLSYCKTMTYQLYSSKADQYEDAVGDAVVKAWDAIVNNRFRGESSIKTWLNEILRNACIDLHRQDVDMVSIDEVINIEAPKENWRDERIDLYKHLPSLSKRQQEIISLTLEGYTQDEISKQLNISQQAVEQLYHRAVKNLQEKMNSTL